MERAHYLAKPLPLQCVTVATLRGGTRVVLQRTFSAEAPLSRADVREAVAAQTAALAKAFAQIEIALRARPALHRHACVLAPDRLAGYPRVMGDRYDLAVVGAGIVGLAHALAGLRLGLRVVVVDREVRAAGASVRNFGFVTVTGQQAGITWRRARRARDVWAEVAPQAGIAVHQRGLLMVARRPEAMAVLEDFVAGAMGGGCRLLDAAGLHAAAPMLAPGLLGGLQSPHELRVESRDAIPQLRAWLATRGVTFLPRTAVRAVEPGMVHTTAGAVCATHVAVCPGADLVTLYPDVMARRGITLCKLHMLRLADPGVRFPAPLMSDLGLVRYLGYEGPRLPELRARLEAEQTAHLANGVHLIVVQHADGSLVVGDSHHYDPTPDPFQPRAVDDLVIDEFGQVTGLRAPTVLERWIGIYPSGPDIAFTEAVGEGVRLVMVTSGTGASTAFAIGEETLADLLGNAPPPHTQGDAECSRQ